MSSRKPVSHSSRWTLGLIGCLLAGMLLTAFLVRLGAEDPYVGGFVLPATVWMTCIAANFASAAVRAARDKRRRDGATPLVDAGIVDSETGSTSH